MNLESQVRTLEALTGDLAKAVTIREKVKLADRIFETLGQCEKIVEQFIVTDMTGRENGNGRHNPPEQLAATRDTTGKQFRGLKLADVGKLIIAERGTLHGKDIEAIAKAGGFKTGGSNFQSYLAVAFKREGGFENIGQNRWKLNESIPPGSRESKRVKG